MAGRVRTPAAGFSSSQNSCQISAAVISSRTSFSAKDLPECSRPLVRFRRLNHGAEILPLRVWWHTAAAPKNESAIAADLVDQSLAVRSDLIRLAEGQQGYYRVYRTQDDFLAVGCLSHALRVKFCRVLGLEDPRLSAPAFD